MGERAFAHLVVLMREVAQHLQLMRSKKTKTSFRTILEFRDVVRILRLLTAAPPNQHLYEMPGMCELAGNAVGTTLHSIVLTPIDLESWSHFRKLLLEVDEYFLYLSIYQPPDALVYDLRRHHGRSLLLFSKLMREYDCVPVHVPQPLKTLDVPEKFADNYTKRLMMRPVRLEATGDVLDYPTLVRLLLVEESLPIQGFSLSFTFLEDLRKEALAWRVEMALAGNDDSPSSDSEDEEMV